MLKLLEEAVKTNEEDLELAKAGVIGIRDSKEHNVTADYSEKNASGIRIYACDANCDNCHCATF